MSEVSVEIPTYEVEVEVPTYDVQVEIPTYDVEVALSGAPGPRGPAGKPGDKGEPGTGFARYTHTQALLSKTWTIVHNLGAHPLVQVEDAVGTHIYGTVQYVDDNTLTLTFGVSATGKANCV